MTVQDSYNEWAETYDSDNNATRDLDQAILKRLLGKSRFNSILEVGTGKNTETLSDLGARVHALDFSEGMLAKARSKCPQTNIVFSLADITKHWPCDSASVDLVTCNLVLEHVE